MIKKKETVLVIDGGGRGSALVEKYIDSKFVKRVLAVPGNDYMLEYSKNIKIYPKLKTTDSKKILDICTKEKVDLIDVAQDNAVEVGLTNLLTKNNFKVFGPTKEAGQIEWDKAWSKNFMQRFKIPTAKFQIFNSQNKAINFIKSHTSRKWFIKASGLAAGKGALFSKDNKEAIKKINIMKSFGAAGKTFLVEECLEGEEFSSFAIIYGTAFTIIGHAQDHKTIYDNNKGPNTGGMGCSSPPKVISKKIEKQIKEIFAKTVAGLARKQRPYTGILYLGGLIDRNGKVQVIEFNARWGDPEAQVIIPSIKNDLFDISTKAIEGKLPKIEKDNKYRIVVAAVATGYPIENSHVLGKKIFNLNKIANNAKIKIFGAGIKKTKGGYRVNGGRLFYVVGSGKNVLQARDIVYKTLMKVYIQGNNLHFRKDIGFRDIERYFS